MEEDDVWCSKKNGPGKYYVTSIEQLGNNFSQPSKTQKYYFVNNQYSVNGYHTNNGTDLGTNNRTGCITREIMESLPTK